jgi:hypothetical protein
MPQHTCMHVLKAMCDVPVRTALAGPAQDVRSEGTQHKARMKDQQRFAPAIVYIDKHATHDIESGASAALSLRVRDCACDCA